MPLSIAKKPFFAYTLHVLLKNTEMEEQKTKTGSGEKAWWEPAVEIFGRVSAWIVVPVIFSLVLGKHLDRRYGTSPWIFLSLTAVAFFISIFGIVKTVRAYIRKIESEDQKAKTGENNGKSGESK